MIGHFLAGASVPGDSGCSTSNDPACRALRDTYSQSTFDHLDQQPGGHSLIGDAFQWVLDRLGDLFHALGGGGATLVALALVIGIGVLIFWRVRRSSDGRVRGTGGYGDAEEMRGVTDDPDAEWHAGLAAAERGDHREAIRRAFRSALLEVVRRGRLPVDSSWTTRELLRAAVGDADLMASLAPAAELFDVAWYSGHAVSAADWELARQRCETVRTLARRARSIAATPTAIA